MLSKVAIHDEFESRGYSYHNLPEFDDLHEQHCDPNVPLSSYHEREVDRLLMVLDHIDEPMLYEHRAPRTGPSDIPPMDQVTHMARLIQSTLHICMYDNALTVIEHMRDYRHESIGLQYLVEDATLQAERSSRVLLAEYYGSPFSDPEPPKGTAHLEDLNEVYTGLLDYLSNQVIRLLISSVQGTDWQHLCVALLARMIAKLKLLGKDPQGSAVNSIRRGKSLEASVGISAQDYYHKNVQNDKTFTIETCRHRRRWAHIVDEITPTVRYFRMMFSLRSWMTSVLKAILDGICGPEKISALTRNNPSSYEINNIVFANYEQSLWSTFNDRQKRTVVTAEESILRFCSAGWYLALGDLRSLLSKPFNKADPILASIDWQGDSNHRAGTGGESGKFDVRCAADFVTVHVLVALSGVFVARPLRAMLRLCAAFAMEDEPLGLYPYERFEMKLSLVVGQKDEDMRSSGQDCTPLSEFRLPEKKENSDPPESLTRGSKSTGFRSLLSYIRPSPTANGSLDLEAGQKSGIAENKSSRLWGEYEKWRAVMNAWEVDTGCITIPCKVYVLTIMSLWLLALTGGVALLLGLRHRSPGFDPSNILILLWTVASFAIVLAKSWYVDEWTWNQFIQCQMPCRSVQELSRASGIPSQILLLHLYQTACSRESRTKLKTRGPYNGTFPKRGRDPAHGFAIDCAFNMETLVACGLLVLKVNGWDGVRLVCIGGRQELETAGGQIGGESKGLICRLPQQRKSTKSEDMELFFEEGKFTWQEGEGLYKNDQARFG